MKPKLVTSALITHGCKVLLIKRKKAPEVNKWSFPGGVGSFEKFADPKLAVQDEVKFDLGVDFNVDSFYTYSFFVNQNEPSIVLHYTGGISGVPEPNPTEVIEWKFISEEDLDEMSEEDFAFDHYEILKKYFNGIPKMGVPYPISS
ncbi:MAG: NUDIX domain-containing protein [Candidatus Nanoarchaeia archaeon]|nr:NUDIX domain-containing protein [Candidatus Nanoarchaeia archaeon]